jgi:ankyrin repeat protein
MKQVNIEDKSIHYQQFYNLIKESLAQPLSDLGVEKAKNLFLNIPSHELNLTYDDYGSTLFLLLSNCHHVELLELALTFKDKGLNIYIHNKAHDNALMVACSTGKFDNVKALLKHGFNIEEKNIDGQNAFLKAITSQSLELVQYLIEEKKCDIHVKDNKEQNAMLYCGYWNCVEILDYLLKTTNLDINSTDNKNYHILLEAISDGGSFAIVEYLIHHTQVNLYHKNNVGDTALSLAIRWRDNDAVDTLLPKYFVEFDDFKAFYELPRIKLMNDSEELAESYKNNLNKIKALEQFFLEKKTLELALPEKMPLIKKFKV